VNRSDFASGIMLRHSDFEILVNSHSALLTLHRAQYDAAGFQIACGTPVYTNQRQIAFLAIKSVVNMSVDIAAKVCSVTTDLTLANIKISKMFSEFVYEELSMLALPSTFAVYHAALLHTQFAGDDFGSAEWETAMQTLKRMLGTYGSRWSIGSALLSPFSSPILNCPVSEFHSPLSRNADRR
jgi:hypothetical protein